MKRLFKIFVNLIKYLQKKSDFIFWSRLFIIIGIFNVSTGIMTGYSRSIEVFQTLPPIESTLMVIINSIILILLSFGDLFFLFLVLAIVNFSPKKNILFILKIFFNLPLIILFLALMLGNIVNLFYYFELNTGNTSFLIGGAFMLAGAYNLFYLSGYGYQRPVRR